MSDSPEAIAGLHPMFARQLGIEEEKVETVVDPPILAPVVDPQQTADLPVQQTPEEIAAEEQTPVEETPEVTPGEEIPVYAVMVNGVEREVPITDLVERYTPEDRTFKVKTTIMGQEIEKEVPLEELKKGYSATEFFTQTRQKQQEEHGQAMQVTTAARTKALEELKFAEEILTAITPGDLDVEALKKARPNDYGELILQNQKTRELIDEIRSKTTTLTAEQQTEQQTQMNGYMQEQFQLARMAVPEWQDPQVYVKDLNGIGEFMTKTIGLSNAELQLISDHRMVRTLHLAKIGHELMKATGTVKNAANGGKKVANLKPGGKTTPLTSTTAARATKVKAWQTARTKAVRTQRTEDWMAARRLRRELEGVK